MSNSNQNMDIFNPNSNRIILKNKKQLRKTPKEKYKDITHYNWLDNDYISDDNNDKNNLDLNLSYNSNKYTAHITHTDTETNIKLYKKPEKKEKKFNTRILYY